MLLLLLLGCTREPQEIRPDLSGMIRNIPSADGSPAGAIARPKTDTAVKKFCGDCHALPRATSFPKSRWDHEVRQGIRLYRESRRDDLVIPDFDAAVAFFTRGAPDEYEFAGSREPLDGRFRAVAVPFDGEPVHAISNLHLDPSKPAAGDLILADLWSGRISRLDRSDAEHRLTTLTTVSNPAHVERIDFDLDGIDDLLVADLGSLNPQDTREGSLWWLKGKLDGSYDRITLRMGLSRTSDVAAIDFDKDGDLDLVVGDFGLHFEGAVYLVENLGFVDGVPDLKWEVLDDRPGLVEVEIVDLDGDSRLDIVTLISQQYETIEAHLNQGDGTFRRQTVYQLGDPASGSSGMEFSDLDGDGDLDVVLTNGDTFDDDLPKPFHRIHVLINNGTFPFAGKVVAEMPGVYCACVGDIDSDGDQDIAAVSLLTVEQIAQHDSGTFDSVIWLEQSSDGDFRRHTIERDRCDSATCRLFDWDGDGDLDLLTPRYNTTMDGITDFEVFENTTL